MDLAPSLRETKLYLNGQTIHLETNLGISHVPTPETVRQLVKRFEENLDSYRSRRYNETQLRREFLDQLFEVLGWDVFNKQGYAEAYKDVIHEDSIEVEGAIRTPD